MKRHTKHKKISKHYLKAVLMTLGVVLSIGFFVWGYQESRARNDMTSKVESNYQRAFHDLNFYLDKIEDGLGEAQVSNSREQVVDSLTTVWRLAYAANSSVGQLALSLMPVSAVQKLLAQLGQFCYKVGIRDLNTQPLSDREREIIRELYNRTRKIEDDLDTLQSEVLEKNMQWIDVESFLASADKSSNDEPSDNAIVGGFKKVNSMVEEYPEINFGPGTNNMATDKADRIKKLPGELISEFQARHIIADLFALQTINEMSVTLNDKNSYKSYYITFKDSNNDEVSAEIAQNGGYVIWLGYDRDVTQQKLTRDAALKAAIKFAEKMGYKNMSPVSFDESERTITFNLVHTEGEILVYPEMISVKIALDNGDVLGVNSASYLFNEDHRHPGKSSISVHQARKKINPRVQIYKSNLALIYNELGEQVLCYEFLIGFTKEDQYRVFINANTGIEEVVQRVKQQAL